jgi:hypothetical protein
METMPCQLQHAEHLIRHCEPSFGIVAACCSHWLTMGNIHDNGFQDIWNGAPRRKLALGILNGCPEAACADCLQIRGADYGQNEEDFLNSADRDLAILKEKTMSIGTLPSLKGLDAAFGFGAAALMEGDFHSAANIFSGLETKFPDFFEIKNNLAATHFFLGNIDKCREVLRSIERIPHNQRLIQSNLMFLDCVNSAGPWEET